MHRTVLISGAGIAGLATAHFLGKAGFIVTLVERSPDFRSGGQAVDIRGAALDVVASMGLLDQANARRTRLKGMSIVDTDGVEVSRTDERTYTAGRLDSPDIEIFRDELCQLLLGALPERAEILNGDSIVSMAQDDGGATVHFERGAPRRFDLVVGADGVYSNVRDIAMPGAEHCIAPLGVALALFTTPNLIDLRDWQLGYRGDDTGFVIYPTRDHSELRIGVGFVNEPDSVPRRDVDAQKRRVMAQCEGLGGALRGLVDELSSTKQFYFGDLAQIHLPAWSQGRVVLVGDAGYCASPFSGQGTSLALVGAYVLGKELARTPGDIPAAFAAYDRRMRPFVDLNQGLVDLTRKGPVPDEILTRAKFGILLD